MRFLIFILLLTPSILLNGQINDGLVLHYNFDENLIDQTGNNNNGTDYGITYGTDRFGNLNSAALFDGINDYVQMPHEELLLNTFTYSMWVKVNELPDIGDNDILLTIGGNGGDHAIVISNQSGSQNNLNGWYGGGYITNNSILRITSDVLPEIDKWYYISLVRDTDNLKLFVDCTMIDSLYSPAAPLYSDESMALLGKRFVQGINKHYDGLMDDLKIYNRALDNSEILFLCNSDGNSTTSMNEILLEEEIIIYPNPTSQSEILIETPLHFFNEIKLYSIAGHFMRHIKFNENNTYKLDLDEISKGTYLIQILSNDQVIGHDKIIKL